MRRLPFVATLLGVVLLASGLLMAAAARAGQQQQRDDLHRDAAQVAASFSSYFERARSLDLLLAHNQTFAAPSAAAVNRAAMTDALEYLQVLYPTSIGETCVIDERGHELARVTEGRPAAASDLSSNEAQNPFFAPTLALPAGQVYQAAPYVSQDTGAWVISNSTWIRLGDGTRLIVHFEVSLASFARYLDAGSEDHGVAVFDGAGRIMLKDHRPVARSKSAKAFAVASWSRASLKGKASGAGRFAGHDAVLQRIDRSSGNANDWFVAEWTPRRASLFPTWVGELGSALGLLLIALALFTLRRQQSTLRAAARLDHLTGLANRRALEEKLDEALDAATRQAGERVAVLLLDLDGFKQINDALGHDKGDLVLQEIARRLHGNVFEYDTAARLGGDEFAVILRHLREADDVAAVAHRLRDALIRPIEIDGVARFVGASVGAAIYPDHGTDAATLLRGADAAMYHAKRERDGVRVYEPGTAAGAAASSLAAELMAAIDDGDIDVVFQPLFSTTTGEIIGVEALARWTRPGFGPVPPVEFIPLAEQTGLIQSLTYRVLRRALDEAVVWRRNGAQVPVSVNLTGHMASDRSLPNEVATLLAERGLGPEALVLEITETVLIRDRAGAFEVLGRLRAAGIRIELDDFGSGYASFSALQDLPLDGVKLDRHLVTNQADGLLPGTISFARRLGLTVVAEGIEDAETLNRVRSLGCHTAQGYHLAYPQPAADIRRLLSENAKLVSAATTA